MSMNDKEYPPYQPCLLVLRSNGELLAKKQKDAQSVDVTGD